MEKRTLVGSYNIYTIYISWQIQDYFQDLKDYSQQM